MMHVFATVHGFMGSEVQACPGATGWSFVIAFKFYELILPSPHLEIPGLGQGFKG
jgi:hypothetical protein